jgi:hypothetical protein
MAASTTELPPRVSTGPEMEQLLPGLSDYSVFNILNLFWAWWFLLQESLIKNIIVAQKDTDGAFSWVEFTPQYYNFLIQLALQLIPQVVAISPCQMPPRAQCLVKKVLFVCILEVLLEGPQKGFFDLLQKSCKAEKWKKWQDARKKCLATWKKETIAGKPTSFSNIPLSSEHPCVSPPREASSVLALAEEKLKILEFKSWKGFFFFLKVNYIQ